MTALAPPPGATDQPARPAAAAARLTRWSFIMLPTYLVVAVAASFVYYGEIPLGDGGLAGWTAEIGLSLLMAAPPVAGVVLAVLALRRKATGLTWVALSLNAALVALAVWLFVNDILMTYSPKD